MKSVVAGAAELSDAKAVESLFRGKLVGDVETLLVLATGLRSDRDDKSCR